MTAASTTFGGTRRSALREFGAAVATIMVKELRSRMRGRRAFVVLTLYLGLLALIAYGSYVEGSARAAAMGNFGGGGFMPGPMPMPVPDMAALGGQANASAIIGQSIFSTLSIFQLILVLFIAPAFTSGQISLEREKQTLDLLVTTPLRPSAIVVGKLAAALAFVVLMIVAAIPITAIVLMYGGAAVDDIVRQQIVLLATALALGAIGLFFSALLKRTQTATVLTYITVLALVLGTLMLSIFWTVVANQDEQGRFGRPETAPEQIMYVNPMVAMLDVVANTEPGYGTFGTWLAALRGESVNAAGGMACNEFGACFPVDQFGNPVEEEATTSGHWWPPITISLTVVALLMTLASTRLVVPAGLRWALKRRRRYGAVVSTSPGVTVDPSAEGAPTIEELADTAETAGRTDAPDEPDAPEGPSKAAPA